MQAWNGTLRGMFMTAFSPVAIVSDLSVGVVMFFALVGLSLRRLGSGMPVAGSCSLAVAAACHPTYNPNGEGGGMEKMSECGEDMAHLPVQWGDTLVDGPVGHCSFCSGDVVPPEDGKEYR